jgi:hypothetical protein
MPDRYASGQELLRFFLNHGYVQVDDDCGKAVICPRGDTDTLIESFTVPHQQPELPDDLVEYFLRKGNFTPEKFWKEIGS